MKFIIQREILLKPLQYLSSFLISRPTMPILSNVLLQVTDGILSLTSTDLEIEIIAHITLLQLYENGIITVPARKFFDICRSLPNEAIITAQLSTNRLLIYSNRSRFLLSTLPAIDFPNLNNSRSEVDFIVPHAVMKYMVNATQFAMAHHDVRYYLNGMLFETEGEKIRAITTDGHRLAFCAMSVGIELSRNSVIVPRKGVIKLIHMLDSNNDMPLHVNISSNNISININNFKFTSKLIDGNFPDYRYVLSQNYEKTLELGCDVLKKALTRVSILSNNKFRSVSLCINANQLKIAAHNQEQEEAEEIIDVNYDDEQVEINLNVSYILDVLNTLKCKNVRILFNDSMRSVKIEDVDHKNTSYIIMPMRL